MIDHYSTSDCTWVWVDMPTILPRVFCNFAICCLNFTSWRAKFLVATFRKIMNPRDHIFTSHVRWKDNKKYVNLPCFHFLTSSLFQLQVFSPVIMLFISLTIILHSIFEFWLQNINSRFLKPLFFYQFQIPKLGEIFYW